MLLCLWVEQTELLLMWGKTNHVILGRTPEVLDAHPHIWCRWKEPAWWFPGAFSGDHHRRATSPLSAFSSAFLVPVATVLTSWKTFTLVIGLLGKTGLWLILNCLLYACIPYLQYSAAIPSVNGKKYPLSTACFLDLALAVFFREQQDTFTSFWNNCWMSLNLPAAIFIS